MMLATREKVFDRETKRDFALLFGIGETSHQSGGPLLSIFNGPAEGILLYHSHYKDEILPVIAFFFVRVDNFRTGIQDSSSKMEPTCGLVNSGISTLQMLRVIISPDLYITRHW